jgi:hypothetical protein
LHFPDGNATIARLLVRDLLPQAFDGASNPASRTEDIVTARVNFEPELPESQQLHVVGRARFGRITIANSDAGAGAYTDVAIEQGHRAVMEPLKIGAV